MGAKKGGRQSSYETHVKPHIKKIEEWCEGGATNQAIAEKLSVGPTAFSRWRGQHKELDEALKRSTRVANDKVVSALFKRACGFEYEEVTKVPAADFVVSFVKDSTKTGQALVNELRKKLECDDNLIISRKVGKMVVPDTAAIMSWLTNKDRDNWKHRSELTSINSSDTADKLDKAKKRMAELDAEEKSKGIQSGTVLELPKAKEQA